MDDAGICSPRLLENEADLDLLDFSKGGGLATVVAQDARSGEVLMVAHANRESLSRTLASGEMHYLSRTRGLWHKGGTSGNVQRVVSLRADCDGDAILALVIPAGPACHTGTRSCFVEGGGPGEDGGGGRVLERLDETIRARSEGLGGPPHFTHTTPTAHAHHPSATANPEAAPSYTLRLLADRNLRLKKIGEEAAELVLACADDDRQRAAEEAADLLYHTLVALRSMGLGLSEMARVLEARSAK